MLFFVLFFVLFCFFAARKHKRIGTSGVCNYEERDKVLEKGLLAQRHSWINITDGVIPRNVTWWKLRMVTFWTCSVFRTERIRPGITFIISPSVKSKIVKKGNF